MARSRYPLTEEVAEAIASYIRAGGYPHVAAGAAGVPREAFDDWLRRGDQSRPSPQHGRFAREVRRATAQARLKAEIETFTARPLDWLRSGPGKETPRAPGWTGNVRAGAAGEPERPDMPGLIDFLLETLGPFPEARVALARALAETWAGG
jgi:hypothetical protein